MKYFFSSLAPNSKNEMYQILGHCDGYVYLKASHSACQIYRKQIFDVFGWKSMKAFAQLDKDGYSCICCTLIPSRKIIIMLINSGANIILCCFSLESGELKTYKTTYIFEEKSPFDVAAYQFYVLNNSQIRCYPSKLCFDDDTIDFPFFIFNLNEKTATFKPYIDFGLVFHDDIDEYENISNIIFVNPTTIVYQYVRNASQYYLKIDLTKLAASQLSSTPDDKGFIQVDGTSGAFKTYASVSFLEHIHHRIQVNAAGNIEFYSLDGYNGIVKGEIEFDDDESTCKETESKQIFYEEFIDFYTLSSRELFFDDVHVFISTPDYFITGYHMVRSLKHIAYMALLPKMKPQELRNLSPFYEFIGFIEKNA